MKDLYLVTTPRVDWMRQVCWLIEQGVQWVQIRDKEASDKALSAQVEALLQWREDRNFSCTILLNDRVHIAKSFGIGVHLGQSDMLPERARDQLGNDVPIGWTIHNRFDLIASQRSYIQYVGVGPMYPTQTKLDTKPVLDVETLQIIVDQAGCPVVAIGGINATNIAAVRRACPWKIAMSSALMESNQESILALQSVK